MKNNMINYIKLSKKKYIFTNLAKHQGVILFILRIKHLEEKNMNKLDNRLKEIEVV